MKWYTITIQDERKGFPYEVEFIGPPSMHEWLMQCLGEKGIIAETTCESEEHFTEYSVDLWTELKKGQPTISRRE